MTNMNETHCIKTKALLLVHLLALILVMEFKVLAQGRLKEASNVGNDRNDSAAFYILGDSSVDCGDNTLFYPLIHSYLSLYSCNGSDDTNLIPHLLAGKMHMPNILPFYSQNGSIDGILKGLNFGSAHATVLNHGSQSYQSVNQQLRQAFDSMQLLQLQLTEDRALSFIRSSIFYVSFGKDDFIDLFMRNVSDDACRKEPLPHECEKDNMHGNTAFGMHDDARGCIEEINEQVLQYNRMLHKQISNLHAELPDAKIVFCDVYQGITTIINNPKRYGFKDIQNACCGLGKYGAEVGCLSKDMTGHRSESCVVGFIQSYKGSELIAGRLSLDQLPSSNLLSYDHSGIFYCLSFIVIFRDNFSCIH